MEDAIDTLRTWLVVVGVVAVAALGRRDLRADPGRHVAVLGELDERGVARTSAARLENRVDRLSRQVAELRGAAGDGDAEALAGRVDTLERGVKSLTAQPTAGGTQQAIDELADRIDELAGTVDELQQTRTTP